MRKGVNLIGLLFFLSVASLNAQMSYYYKGEKIDLVVNRDYVNVIADDEFMNSESSKMLFQRLNMERDDNKQIPNMAKLKLKSKPDASKYSGVVDELKQNSQIKYVLPFFERGDAEPIGTSDVFYLKLKDTKDIVLLRNTAEKLNVQVIKQVPYMPLWYILSIQNSAFGNAIEASNYFYETGYFEDVDPAFMFNFKTKCTNDTQFGQLWGLKNTSNPTIDINVCDAWEITKGANVKVAILDQGIDPNHDDLSANLHPTLSFNAQTGTSPSAFIPGLNHGTQVAGVIAALRDNNLQVAGVAPEAKIMGISHIMFPTPSYSAELASGISWAYLSGADIINNSWGDQGGFLHGQLYSSNLEDAIMDAIKYGRGGKGTVVIFSSGDYASSGPVMDYPGNFYYNILTVGSIDNTGQRSVFSPTQASGYGPQLDVVAPGSNILSTMWSNTTGYLSGTSMAAAHVSGIAALMLSINPNLTGQQVRDIIEKTAKKVGGYSYTNTAGRPNGIWNNQMGYGLVNAKDAVIEAMIPRGVVGTVFPFVPSALLANHYPGLVAELATTAALYDVPSYPLDNIDDLKDFINNESPQETTTAVRYTKSIYVPGTPLIPWPGYPNRGNPGYPINWDTPPSNPIITRDALPGEVPPAVGVYYFQGVPAKDYILVLSRPGFVSRFAKITVPAGGNMFIEHRELIGGDVDGNLIVDENDLDAHIRVTYDCFFPDDCYDPKYDINGDSNIDSMDMSTLKGYLSLIKNSDNFNVELYQDTDELLNP